MFIHSMDYNKYLYIYIYEKIANKKDDGKGESLYIYIHRLGPIMHQASKTQPLEALETNLAYLDRVPLV